MGEEDLIERIKDKFKWACYSSKLNKIILVKGGRTELVGGKDFYTYADEELFGKYMDANKLESTYDLCWEL